MSEFYTRAEIEFYPEFVNHWLRFGTPDHQLDLDRRRAIVFFKPGKIFGYIRWIANAYGTQVWLFTVARTGYPSARISRIEGIHPGGEVLLSATGNTKVKRTLLQIDMLEESGLDPSDVSPAYLRHIHNRIAAGRAIRAYCETQHEAHLAARRVVS